MKTLDDVRKLTNVDDLIRPMVADPSPPQLLSDDASSDEPFVLPAPVNDPVRAQHYEAAFAERFASGAPLKRPVRAMAWMLLAVPGVCLWLMFVVDFVRRASWRDIYSAGDIFALFGAFLFVTAFAGLWPYVLLRRPASRK